MAFDQDLKAGHRSEDRVLHIIQKRYSQAKRIDGKHSPYDIIVHNYQYKDIQGPGDRHAKRVYLIPVDTYRTFASVYYDYKG